MPIYENSRYENATVLQVSDADGVPRPTVYAVDRLASGRMRFNYHVVRAGEYLDTLAAVLLGSPQLWWMIADLNPELLDPQDLAVGAVIRVPR